MGKRCCTASRFCASLNSLRSYFELAVSFGNYYSNITLESFNRAPPWRHQGNSACIWAFRSPLMIVMRICAPPVAAVLFWMLRFVLFQLHKHGEFYMLSLTCFTLSKNTVKVTNLLWSLPGLGVFWNRILSNNTIERIQTHIYRHNWLNFVFIPHMDHVLFFLLQNNPFRTSWEQFLLVWGPGRVPGARCPPSLSVFALHSFVCGISEKFLESNQCLRKKTSNRRVMAVVWLMKECAVQNSVGCDLFTPGCSGRQPKRSYQ